MVKSLNAIEVSRYEGEAVVYVVNIRVWWRTGGDCPASWSGDGALLTHASGSRKFKNN